MRGIVWNDETMGSKYEVVPIPENLVKKAEAFRMQRFAPVEPKGEKEKSDGASSSAAITALRMFRPPLRAKVTLHDGKPKHVVCLKRKEISGDILWMAGPWRSSGDWWEQDGWARDEWDIALQWPAKTSSQLPVLSSPLPVGRSQADQLSAISHQPSAINRCHTSAALRFVSGRGFSRAAQSSNSKAALAAEFEKEKYTMALYRLVHDLLSGHWFVEGTYD